MNIKPRAALRTPIFSILNVILATTACTVGAPEDGHEETLESQQLPLVQAFDPGLADSARAFADVNADGAADYCRIIESGGSLVISCMLADPATKTFGAPYGFNSSGPIAASNGLPQKFVDVTGDKRADFCQFVSSSPGSVLSCTRATSSGFDTSSPVASPAGIDVGDATAPRTFIDANKDGRADYCRIIGSGTTARAACTLSLGSAFEALDSYVSAAGIDVGSAARPRAFIDMNRDGYVDFCRVLSNGKNQCSLGSATGFQSTPGYASASIVSSYAPSAYVAGTADARARYCYSLSTSGNAHIVCELGEASGFSGGNYPMCCWDGVPRDAGLPEAFVNVTDYSAKGLPEYCRFVSGKLACARPMEDDFGIYDEDSDYLRTTVDPGLAAYPREFADVDADGYADYCRVLETSSGLSLSCALAGTTAGSEFKTEMKMAATTADGVAYRRTDSMLATHGSAQPKIGTTINYLKGNGKPLSGYFQTELHPMSYKAFVSPAVNMVSASNRSGASLGWSSYNPQDQNPWCGVYTYNAAENSLPLGNFAHRVYSGRSWKWFPTEPQWTTCAYDLSVVPKSGIIAPGHGNGVVVVNTAADLLRKYRVGGKWTTQLLSDWWRGSLIAGSLMDGLGDPNSVGSTYGVNVQGTIMTTWDDAGVTRMGHIAGTSGVVPGSLVQTGVGIFAVTTAQDLIRAYWENNQWNVRIVNDWWRGNIVWNSLIPYRLNNANDGVYGVTYDGVLFGTWRDSAGIIQFGRVDIAKDLAPASLVFTSDQVGVFGVTKNGDLRRSWWASNGWNTAIVNTASPGTVVPGSLIATAGTGTGAGVYGITKQGTLFVAGATSFSVSSVQNLRAGSLVLADSGGVVAVTTSGQLIHASFNGVWVAEVLSSGKVSSFLPGSLVRGSSPRARGTVFALSQAGQLIAVRSVGSSAVIDLVPGTANLVSGSLKLAPEGVFAVKSDGQLVLASWNGMTWTVETP